VCPLYRLLLRLKCQTPKVLKYLSIGTKISNEAEHCRCCLLKKKKLNEPSTKKNNLTNCRCCLLSFAGFLALSFASQGMEEEPTHPSPERDTPPHAAAATLPSLQLSENHQYGAPSQKKPVCGGGGGGKGSTASDRGGGVTLWGGGRRWGLEEEKTDRKKKLQRTEGCEDSAVGAQKKNRRAWPSLTVTQFTSFTSTQVQILTPVGVQGGERGGH
jgi:hypothetical protein